MNNTFPLAVKILRDAANRLCEGGFKKDSVAIEMCITRFVNGDSAVNENPIMGEYIGNDAYFEADAYTLGAEIIKREANIAESAGNIGEARSLDECANIIKTEADYVRRITDEEGLVADWYSYL